ncbi:MAG TPA: zf-HC2 domain-containing protein [Duganella sp.]|uniref:zf-HC2 domain-containing protein n=1 Tax=Duganella sp. TaxID=1904440 RepID=UPI002ED6B27A
MNGRVFRMDIPAHQAVQELLPWYASSQLPADDAQRVEQHLHVCEQCRQDLQWERELRAETQADAGRDALALPEGVDMERAWARMMPALGAQDPVDEVHVQAPAAAPATTGAATPPAAPPLSPQRWWRTGAANQPAWLRWAVAAQWVLIVGLVALLARPDPAPAAYHVLGNGVGGATGNLVVMFHPNTTERELRRILQAQGARVVDGPTVTDAYLLSVPEENRDSALQALRANPAVKLAEALDEGGAP